MSTANETILVAGEKAEAEHALIRSRIEAARRAWRNRSSGRPAGQPPPARITVTLDVGDGNFLTLRSNQNNWGAPGVPLQKLDANEWEIQFELEAPIEFKLTLNDETWEEGPNQVIEPGGSIRHSPKFPAAGRHQASA